jgi:hypothetical protein
MVDADLSTVPLPDLIVELLLDGRAGYLPALLPFEPIDATAILAELQRRTGEVFGADMHAWRDWFLATHGDAVDRGWVELAETKRRIRIFERRALRKLRR